MPSKGMSTRLSAMRLPVQTLRVKRPNKHEPNSCIAVMSSVLSCWASSGHSVQGCAAVEMALRTCMDAPKPKGSKKNTINYHLTRMFPKMSGPKKRKGSLG